MKHIITQVLLISVFLFLSCNKENDTRDFNLNDGLNSENIYAILDEIKWAKNNRNVDLQIQKNIELANIFTQIYETDQALNYLNTALLLSKEKNKNEYLNIIYHKLGDIYLFNNHYKKAKQYFTKAYKLSILQNERDNIIEDLMKLGFVVHKQNNLDSARFYYQKILKIIDANDSKTTLPIIYVNLADLYVDEGSFNEAKTLYKKGIDTSIFYHVNNYLDVLYLNLGKVYSGQNKFDSAHYAFLKCDSLIDLTNNTTLKTECNYWLLRNTILQKSNTELLKYLEYNKIANDSVNLYQNAKWQKYAEFNYQLGKKEAELNFLQEQNYNQKLKFAFIIIILLLIGLILLILIKHKNKKLILLSKENEIKQLKEQQLKDEANKIRLELEIKNKEVLSNSIILLNKNELLDKLRNTIKQIQVSDTEENKHLINEIISLLRDSTNQDNIWNDFKIHFEKVHQNFFERLTKKHPNLSENDSRLCAYLMIGMQNQEIASISFISPESVRKRKQRLKEKLNLESETNLTLYIKSI